MVWVGGEAFWWSSVGVGFGLGTPRPQNLKP